MTLLRHSSLLVVLLLSTPAMARVAGGGPKASDCYAVLDGVTATKRNRVVCVDGDPACDHDGSCDGTCEFHLRLCVNQCEQPKTVEVLTVKGAPLDFPPLPATGPACGDEVAVVSRKPPGRKPKPGKIRVSFTALVDAKPRADRDKVTLVCKPRKDECPKPIGGRETPRFDPPPLLVDPPSPPGGTEATVTLAAPADASTSLAVSGQACGELAAATGVGPLERRARVGTFGDCELVATVTPPGSAPQTFTTHFRVIPTALTLPGLRVPDAEFLPGELPPQTGSPDDPVIASVSSPGTLINGGTVQLRLTLANPALAATVRAVQVQALGVGGDAGFFEAPPTLDGSTVVLELRAGDEFAPASTEVAAAAVAPQVEPVAVNVQLVSTTGKVGNRVNTGFDTRVVSSGPVQVSLSWDSATDLDLHLIEPDGTEVFYFNRHPSSGGVLDLDSNSSCTIDGINNENITYPSGAPPGEYIVRVDFFSDCEDFPAPGLPAEWTVTTRVCGEVTTYKGRFAAGESDQGGYGAGIEVARFNPQCDYRVRGKAKYEDFAPGPKGLSTTASTPPIRFARVAVLRASDDTELGHGETDQEGKFDVRFKNEGQLGYYVQVQSQSSERGAMLQQSVGDGQLLYAANSEGIDETAEPDKRDVEIVARGNDGAAFNIYDQGVDGGLFLRSRYGAAPPRLSWVWTPGKAGECGESSCFFEDGQGYKISVAGTSANPAQHNDAVLLHEYGHFWLRAYSGHDDSPGGAHGSVQQDDPRLAWSEGAATFFSCRVRGNSVYVSVTASDVNNLYSIDLATGYPLGTSDGSQTGALSETVVAGILWDLVDPPSSEEPIDTVANTYGVFDAVGYLAGPKFNDRAVTGVDLVDFLDGWFCKGHNERGDATSGVQGIVTGIHQFNYDFAPVADCR